MKKRLLSLASILTVLTSAEAQPPTLPGKASRELNFVKDGSSFSVQLYGVQQPDGSQAYFAWPTFAYRADERGKLVVQVESPQIKNGKSEVKVFLLINPVPLMNAARTELSLKGKTEVIGVDFRRLVVKQFSGDLFPRFEITGETKISEIPLVAQIPEADAEAFATDLRNGKKTLEFRINAQLYAKREMHSGIGTVRLVKLQDTTAGTALAGSAGSPGIVLGGNSVTSNAGYVNRVQEQKLRADFRDELAISFQITGSPKKLDVLMKLIDLYLDKHVFGAETPIELNVANIQSLNQYSFDKEDLKPDVITKTLADIRNFLSSESQDKFSLSAGGSFLGISANASFTKESLKKHLEDRGWKFEQTGTKYIPKSMSVRTLNTQAITAHAGFSAAIFEDAYSDVDFETVVGTRTRLDPEATLINHPSALAEQIRQLIALRTELTASDAEREKLIVTAVGASKHLEAIQHEIARFKSIAGDATWSGAKPISEVMIGSLQNWMDKHTNPENTVAQLDLARHTLKHKNLAEKVEKLESHIKSLLGK